LAGTKNAPFRHPGARVPRASPEIHPRQIQAAPPRAKAASVIPNQFAAFAFEQADCSISVCGVENDDHPERLGSAGRAKDISTIIVSGIAARALVWIGAAHRALPNATHPQAGSPIRAPLIP
jgi:hypothetical protein